MQHCYSYRTRVGRTDSTNISKILLCLTRHRPSPFGILCRDAIHRILTLRQISDLGWFTSFV